MKVLQSLFASLLFAGSLAAQPQGFHLAAGDASAPVVDALGNMVIQSGSKAIVNWDSFSIAAAEQIHFQQRGSTSAVLNRVTGSESSDLLGLLSSNGRVLLINPNGVFIGQAGRIETADFLASTFDVFDADFLQEKDLLFCGDSGKSIQNLGTISCPTGNIHLFASHVGNDGVLQAASGKILLAAGGDILLQKDGTSHIYIRPELFQEEIEGAAIDNKGSIEAMVASLQAGDSPYAKAIRCSGTINATTVQAIGGEIYLVAQKGITEIDGGALTAPGGTVHVLGEKVGLQNDSRIDVSAPSGGGTILVGGDWQGKNPEIQNAVFAYVSKGSEIKADALENGNGGKVIVWSDEGTFAYGNLSACGGQISGDGGFIEVSGPTLEYRALAKTLAPHGKTGTLLLDPIDVIIDNVATAPGSFTACPGGYNFATGATNEIFFSDLQNQLLGCNVTIDTVGTGAGGAGNTGSIMVNTGVTWGNTNTLTLTAESFIAINQGISNTAPSSAGTFTAMTFTANGTGSSAAGITVGAGLSCMGFGNITLTGTGGTAASNMNGISVTQPISTLGSVALSGTAVGTAAGSSNVGVSTSGAGTITAGAAGSASTITFSGTGGNGTTLNHGVSVVSALTLSGTGSINFSNCLGSTTATSTSNRGAFISGTTCTASQGSINFSNCIGGKGSFTAGVLLQNSNLSAQNIIATGIQGGSGADECFGFSITSTSPTPCTLTASELISLTVSGGSGVEAIGVICAGFSNTIQATGNGSIVFNGTGGGTAEGIGIGGCANITTDNGNISFNGSVAITDSCSTMTTTGTGSVFFSSTIDNNNLFGNVPPFNLNVNAGGSIAFSGAIGSSAVLTNITAQIGSGFSTSPTLGTVPNGTLTFGGPTVTATGAITLNSTGRTQPMSIATIIGTGNLTFTSSSFTMGVNESMTVLGNLIIDGVLSLSDIVAAGNLTLTGSPITLNAQAPASYLASDGSFYLSPNAHIFGLNAPTVSTSVTPAGSRVLASGFSSETSFAKVLKLGSVVLNYDIHGGLPPLAQAAVNQIAVANAQLVANGPWGLLPILDLRFFPIYAICPVNTKEQPCTTGMFVPFIFESDIIDGNIFRSL